MFYFSVFLIVASNIVYHVSQKSVPGKADPILSTLVSYGMAILTTLALYPVFSRDVSVFEGLKELNWTSYVLGIAIVGVEIGFLLAYRAGGNISLASVICSVFLALILIPIGIYYYGEHLHARNFIGIGLCLAGLYLATSK